MSKAVSWSKTGSGFDAREAARDAARRQGKSLGEWLHGVIAENAGEAPLGGEASSRERIEAVTARLERMGATAARGAAAPARSKLAPRAVDEPDDMIRASALRDGDGEGDRRGEPRSDDAIASVTRLIEANERRRERDRAGVESLAQKLADIETRLSSRDETPIKGTLARLEARLEQISRRGEAESSARALVAAQAAEKPRDDEPIRRLEAKLNAVLDAVAAPRPVAPSAPAVQGVPGFTPAAPQVELPLRRRRLGEAIAEIADRQRALEPVPRAARAPGAGVPALRAGRTTEIAAEGGPLPARLDGIRRAMAASAADTPLSPAVDDALRRDIAAMAEQLRDADPRGALAAMDDKIARLASRLDDTRAGDTDTAIGELRAEMRAMGGRLEQVQELAAHPAAPDLTTLEQLVRELGLRIEAVQAPGAEPQAIDALQREIGTLATRLERTETGLGAIASIESSMRELFAHLEETRGFAETAASRAASEAVRNAIAEKGFDRPAPRADVAVLKAMQEDADVRTRATLDVVHEALDKVVDRLAVLEHGLAEARVARATRDEATLDGARAPNDERDALPGRRSQPAAELELGAGAPLVDPRFEPRPAKPRKAADPKSAHAKTPDPMGGAGQAEFIAAARRAAHAAQTDPAVLAVRRPLAATAADEPVAARAGLAAKSRDYVSSHKRPVLMALAAVLVVAATAALVQRMPFGAPGPELAEAPAPTRIAAAPSRAKPQDDAMAARPLPRATPAIAARIPGSDPVVTGSIPALPAFAARAAAPAPRPAILPAGLAAAAESGDGAAQYTLAAAYAEGRAVPRDLARAAKLYAKAADKGIVPAQYRLGALYEKGLGVAQDKAHARSLYQQAADAGSPRAMHNLAVLLADGDGKPDYEGAATWFRRAAQLGVHDSQFNLAILLARGLGVDQSLVQSYQWFSIAAAQGDTDAAGKRDEVATKLSPSELSVAKALAAAFHAREPDAAAVDVQPPPGGWDGTPTPARFNSGRSKISSL